MSLYHTGLHVEDIRTMKERGEKISMLYVTSHDEAAAAAAGGIHMLSIGGRFFDAAMREAAGNCFVQVGLPCGPHGPDGRRLVTAEDYLHGAHDFGALCADCPYCAASYDIQKVLCDNHVAVVTALPRWQSPRLRRSRRNRGNRSLWRAFQDEFDARLSQF
jgi:3-methyl-2-oxobutanoate hydroxymethyltransferase